VVIRILLPGSELVDAGRQPWKVELISVSMMSGMEVVMALLFGHFDGEVQAAGDPGWDDAPKMAAPRSRSRGRAGTMSGPKY
jgi:hypothetical protein